MSQRDFFRRKRNTNCGSLLAYWAEQRHLPVRSTASVRTSADNKKGPYSEMCLSTGCAGRPVRAFARDPKYGQTGVIYNDKRGMCQFTSGIDTEVLPPGFWRAAGVASFQGARRRKRRR